MSAAESVSLVSGGNVKGGTPTIATAKLSIGQTRLFRFFHFCQIYGLLLLGGAFMWLMLYVGYLTWHTRINATNTMFKASLTGTHVFSFNPTFWAVLVGVGLLGAFGGPLGKDTLLRSAWNDRMVLMMLIMLITVAMLMGSVVLSAILGATFKWGNTPDEKGIRTAADAWIAEHINLQVNYYNVDFHLGAVNDPTFLRSLKPDGSLDQVYKIVSDGSNLSITPVN